MADETRYHINPESGRPNICRATGKRGCKYKNEDGTEPPHFLTKEAAQAFQNERDEEEYGAVATLSKKPRGANKATQEEGPGDGLSDVDQQRAVALIESDIDTPEYNAARDKLRSSVSDYYYQSKDYLENEARGGMDLSDDAAELRHITQVVQEDMANLERLSREEPQVSDDEHAANLAYLRSKLEEDEQQGEGDPNALRIITKQEMKDYHAQGEKEYLEAREEYLKAEERAVDMENDMDNLQEELHSLKLMRQDLDEDAKVNHGEELETQRMEVESRIDEVEKSIGDIADNYDGAINQLNEARECMYTAQKNHLGSFEQQQQMAEIDQRIESFQDEVKGEEAIYEEKAEMKRYLLGQMTSMEQERKELLRKPSRTPMEESRFQEIERNLETVRSEFPGAAREAYEAQYSLVSKRDNLENERWRKTELQGEIYKDATGNVVDYAPTDAEDALDNATREADKLAVELEELNFSTSKAQSVLRDSKSTQDQREKAQGDLLLNDMNRMRVESRHMDAVEKQYQAQEALYKDRGWR